MNAAAPWGWSLAVVEDGDIVVSECHGDRGDGRRVTVDTVFQAGSISKPVAALALLRLGLPLDVCVNELLTSWLLPDAERVTMRHLLAHAGGLSVHGFLGYPRTADVPTLTQVLDGARPANSDAVRVVHPIGETVYSGGGYVIAQLAAEDASGRPFAELARDLVLEPFGMHHSAFGAEPPAVPALGHWPNDAPVIGGWHVHPELTAAGLWTTAEDLAMFVSGVCARTDDDDVATFLTPAFGGTQGLGPRVKGTGDDALFFHGGINCGYMALLIGVPSRHAGLALLTNAMHAGALINDVAGAHIRERGWPALDLSTLPGTVAT